MKNKLHILIISVLLLSFCFASAQSEVTDYEFVNTNDGFPKRGITSITPDEKGFIWIGTFGAGLYRYDGVQYLTFRHDFEDSTTISSDIVNVIFKDSKGEIWVGTNSGLNTYDQNTGHFSSVSFSYEHADEKNIDIVAITENPDGHLFIGSNSHGLFVIKKGENIAKHVDYKSEKNAAFVFNVTKFAVSAGGHIYAATNQGLKIYDAEENTLIDAEILLESGNRTLDMPLSSVLIDEMNNLWIGSQRSGIYKTSCLNAKPVSLKYLEHFPVTTKRVLSIDNHPDGRIFFGTENDGLFILNSNGEVTGRLMYDKENPRGLKSNSVWKVFIDAEERLWLGYYDKGVDVYDPLYSKFDNFSKLSNDVKSINESSVTGLIADENDNIWVALDGGGLFYYNRKNRTFTQRLKTLREDHSNAAMQTVFIDSKKNVWAGSWDEGIFLLKNGADKFVQFTAESTNGQMQSNRVLSFTEDTRGRIWFGTFEKGIHSYNPENGIFEHQQSEILQNVGIPDYDVRKIMTDEDGDIWVGTTKGLFRLSFNEMGEISDVFSFSEKYKSVFRDRINFNNILCFAKTSDGNLWIGTDGAGLLRYQTKTDSLSFYNEKNGFGQHTVAAIIEAEAGQIWVSGRSGLSHIDLTKDKIKNYSKEDGLVSNDFNNNAVIKDSKGHLYFGNVVGGVNYFSPNSIPTNQSDIHVILTNLKLFNKTVIPGEKDLILDKTLEVTDEITFNYLQSVFTIEYTGVSFTRAEKNQFAYYLEGLEDDWNYVDSKRSATYTSLKSGDYIFKVKAANNDGLWNEEPVELRIKVLPPIWRSEAGFFTYIVLFVGVLYLFSRMLRNRVLAKEERENEQLRRAQEKELTQQKFQFFTNISHEFRTPLTLIINPLEDILNNDVHDLPDEVHSKHLIIHKNSKRLERLINELMDFRKLSFNKMKLRLQRVEIIDYLNAVSEYFQGEALDSGIELSVVSKIGKQETLIDPGLIEKVLFNLLSNAFKVTTTGGEIKLTVSTTEKILPDADAENTTSTLVIAVSDTGPGLSEEDQQYIFERFYQADSVNKSYYGGTGIGLEVVKKFVKLHKGIIEVDSKPEEGTCFTIYLPLNNETTKEKATESALDLVAEDKKHVEDIIENTDLEKTVKTLLVVEDNIELRNYLQTELRKDYRVKTAADGAEGLKKAIEILPDLIVTDVMMPRVDGFELCKKIKADIRTCHIPLLMLTAKSSLDDEVIGIDSGADAYLTKPFNMSLLKAKLNQLLNSRQVIFNKYFSEVSESKINKNTTSLDKDFIQKILTHIHKRIGDTNLSVETLAAEVFLSRSQLYRKIKALTGMSVNEFIRRIRLEEAKKILESKNSNISEVCYAVGFSSPSYFSKCFKEHFGVLPTEV